MTTEPYIEKDFNRKKNAMASLLTLLICGLLFLFLYWYQWVLPAIPPVFPPEGIEVNLGNSDMGTGEIAPQNSEAPAPESAPTSVASTTPAEPENPTNEAPDSDIPNEKKYTPKKIIATPTKHKKAALPKTVTNKKNTNTPPVPKPKTLMPKYTGGTGKGGNNAAQNNGITNQGNDANAKGDKGQPNGSLDGKLYAGGGIRIREGLNGRRITKLPSFRDEFNENAKIAVDITIDPSGNVLTAIVNLRGTTTANQQTRNVALKRAKELKFNAGQTEQRGTIIMDMRVTN